MKFTDYLLRDMIHFSTTELNAVASEEAIRVMLHCLFHIPSENTSNYHLPIIIDRTEIENVVRKINLSTGDFHRQFLIQSGNRSNVTQGDPDSIHYAALDVLKRGDKTVVLYADHCHGKDYILMDEKYGQISENTTFIFAGGSAYQNDHNHCYVFAIQHLLLTAQDTDFHNELFGLAERSSLKCLKINWHDLKPIYNYYVQSYNGILEYIEFCQKRDYDALTEDEKLSVPTYGLLESGTLKDAEFDQIVGPLFYSVENQPHRYKPLIPGRPDIILRNAGIEILTMKYAGLTNASISQLLEGIRNTSSPSEVSSAEFLAKTEAAMINKLLNICYGHEFKILDFIKKILDINNKILNCRAELFKNNIHLFKLVNVPGDTTENESSINCHEMIENDIGFLTEIACSHPFFGFIFSNSPLMHLLKSKENSTIKKVDELLRFLSSESLLTLTKLNLIDMDELQFCLFKIEPKKFSINSKQLGDLSKKIAILNAIAQRLFLEKMINVSKNDIQCIITKSLPNGLKNEKIISLFICGKVTYNQIENVSKEALENLNKLESITIENLLEITHASPVKKCGHQRFFSSPTSISQLDDILDKEPPTFGLGCTKQGDG